MDEIRSEKLRQVIHDRVTLGVPLETLRQELCTRLDEAAANDLLDSVVGDIERLRETGEYDGEAELFRKRHFKKRYASLRTLAVVLLVIGTVGTLTLIFGGSATLPLAPLAVGTVILVVTDGRIRTRTEEARDAVDQLFARAA